MSSDVPEKRFADPVQRVLLTLRDSSRSHIILAVADSPELRREGLAEVAQHLSGIYALHEFNYVDTTQPSLPRFCRTLRDTLPACVLAHGLETLQLKNADAYRAALDLLNAHREDIRDTKTTVILLVSAATLADVLQFAPDFADWRSADVTFTLPDSAYSFAPTTLGSLSLAEAERLRAQARRYEEMLRRPGVDPTLAAEYQKQLGYVRKQLGQDVESKTALSAASQTAATQNDFKQLESLYRQHVIDRYSKLTLYSVNSDAPLAVDLECVFVKLCATSTTVRDKRYAIASSKISQMYREVISNVLATEKFSDMSSFSESVKRQLGAKFKPGQQSYSELFAAFRDIMPTLQPDHDKKVSLTETITFEINMSEAAITDWKFISSPSASSLLVSDVLRNNNCVVITGAPGAGKTTLLKYIALTFVRTQSAKRLNINEEQLPILIALRDFSRYLDTQPDGPASPDTLPQFLQCHFAEVAPHLNLPEMFFRSALDKQECVVLLDGLDEVADAEKRLRVIDMIGVFVRFHAGNRFVLSSRPRGYESEARQRLAPQFAEYAIRDFDDADMSDFAQRWYEAVTRDRVGSHVAADVEAKTKADDLLTAIKADNRVRALASNPLLLSVLAMVHQRGATLPQRRTELYDECTDLLLGYWDQTKGNIANGELTAYGGLSRSERRVLLEPIALWMHERGEAGQEVKAQDLEAQLVCQFQEVLGDKEERARERAQQFLKLIIERAGLLVERENGVYAFSHLTFQEYLAARAIADRDDFVKFTLDHLHDPWWQEVVLLEVGHVSDVRHYGRRARKLTTELVRAIYTADSYLEPILKRDLLFAARALADVGTLGVEEELRKQIIAELLKQWRTMPHWEQQQDIISILDYLLPTSDGEAILQELLNVLSDQKYIDHQTEESVLSTLRYFGSRAATPKAVNKLLELTCTQDDSLRIRAIRALNAIGSTASETVKRLQELTHDTHRSVRKSAIDAFGNIQTEKDDVLIGTRLIELVTFADQIISSTAARALGRNSKKWPEAISTLLKLSSSDDAFLRTAAVTGLTEVVRTNPTEAVVQQILALTADKVDEVRNYAIDALSCVDSDTWTIAIRNCLLSLLEEGNWKGRYLAARAFAGLGEKAATADIIHNLVMKFAVSPAGERDLLETALLSMRLTPVKAQTVEQIIAMTYTSNHSKLRQVLRLLSAFGPKAATAQAVARLTKMSKSKSIDVYVWAMQALGEMGAAASEVSVVECLLDLSRSNDVNMQQAAVKALAKIGSSAINSVVTARLVELLNGNNPNLRAESALALNRIGIEKQQTLLQIADFWCLSTKEENSDIITHYCLRALDTTSYRELQKIARLLPRTAGKEKARRRQAIKH